jgi:hypothetical protein
MKKQNKNFSIFMLCVFISVGFGWVMTYSGWDNPLDMVRAQIRCDDGSAVLVRVDEAPPASCRNEEVTK